MVSTPSAKQLPGSQQFHFIGQEICTQQVAPAAYPSCIVDAL